MRICTALLLAALAEGAAIEGGARFGGGAIAYWGDGVRVSGRLIAQGRYGQGGCVADWDGDGAEDLIVQPVGKEGRRMVALLAPEWREEPIDGDALFRDCLAATLHGRAGVLVTHRQMQLRFYERGRGYRELYSIYTASAQSGLLLADLDGDGREELLHGDYWLRAPESFELPWRLFALQTWFDAPRGAMVRIALAKRRAREVVVEAESEAAPARFSWFERPEDIEQLWAERRIAVAGGLRRPQALAAEGAWVLAGEDAGAGSRLTAVNLETGETRVAGRSEGFLEVWIEPHGRVTALTRSGVRRYRWRR